MLTKLLLCASMLAVAPAEVSKQNSAADNQKTTAAAPKASGETSKKADAPKTKSDAPKATSESQKTSADNQKKQADDASNEKQSNDKPSQAASNPDEKEVNGVKMATIEANIIAYTNEQRASYGLPPLEVDADLMETAREHAAWMTRNYTLTHTRQPVAENIAMGQPHSSDVVQSWMNSSGHRANILSSGHRRIGVAAFRAANGIIFWCQQFRD